MSGFEPLRCCPTFRSKEQARTNRLGGVPDSVVRAPLGVPGRLVDADAMRPFASHAIAAAVEEWEFRQRVGEAWGEGAEVWRL